MIVIHPIIEAIRDTFLMFISFCIGYVIGREHKDKGKPNAG
jgi:hypothetical protein